ncbi:hypothetical protein HBH56_180690 [Parastagonospora nodorum]|nr:hypothetical protein HBH56_180690 [Parastagonospora nodorum]KAH3969066.1 hypothetical protein HBH52_174140 [Parastagonospora nodorum]KAH4042889.1 hypothetical protein HBH49_241720 [Parastagonospora nodorum]KAH4064197.1 hypothetical protein HBH50_176050 [Parastagonospora nodorum]KAH4081393.1 hypothetical protein HBH46_225450 [Parastagonospora nodorum]
MVAQPFHVYAFFQIDIPINRYRGLPRSRLHWRIPVRLFICIHGALSLFLFVILLLFCEQVCHGCLPQLVALFHARASFAPPGVPFLNTGFLRGHELSKTLFG